MTNKEAKELLIKLQKLENNCEMETGSVVHKFLALPLDYIDKNNIEIDWYKVWDIKYDFQKDFNPDLKYNIIALHRADYSTILYDLKIDRYKKLLDSHQ
ncbi:MAG: hypothetical protein ACX93I_12360 [Winogradskyella sp.]